MALLLEITMEMALDLCVSNGWGGTYLPRDQSSLLIHGPTVLLHNTHTGNWAVVRLHGTTSNRNAIGTRVQVQAGGLTLRRDVGRLRRWKIVYARDGPVCALWPG